MDIVAHGIEAFTFDILDLLEPQILQTAAELRADLEAPWREKLTDTDLN